jgi:shikimate kinase
MHPRMPNGANEVSRVVLVGMMGSGKTSVGQLLAQRTGWPLRDNDSLLRERFGATARELLAAGDESTLLAAEVEVLLAGLAAPAPSIVAAAARTILDPATRTAMTRAGSVVWLRVSPDTVRRRAAGGEHRPWPAGDRDAWIRAATAERDPLYAAIADLALDADDTPASVLADEVLAYLRRPES